MTYFMLYYCLWSSLIIVLILISLPKKCSSAVTSKQELESLAVYDTDLNDSENEDEEGESPLKPLWSRSREDFARPVICEIQGREQFLACLYTLPNKNTSSSTGEGTHGQNNSSSVQQSADDNANNQDDLSSNDNDSETLPMQLQVNLRLKREDYLYSTTQISFYDIPQFLCHSKANCQLDNWYVVQRGLVEYVDKIVRFPHYSRVLLDIQGFVYARVRDFVMKHKAGLGGQGIMVGNSINNPKERHELSTNKSQTLTTVSTSSSGIGTTNESNNETKWILYHSAKNASQRFGRTEQDILLADELNNALSKEQLSQHNLTKIMEKAYTIAIVLTPTSRIVKPTNEMTSSVSLEPLLRPSDEMLNSLSFEVYDLRFFFKKIYIYYGYAVIPSRQQEFIDYCNYINDYFDARFATLIKTKQLEILCLGYEYPFDLNVGEDDDQKSSHDDDSQKGSTDEQVELNEDQKSSKHLFYKKHFDVRNEILKQTWPLHNNNHDEEADNNIDYYVFLDINPSINHLYSTQHMEWAFVSSSQYEQERYVLQAYRPRWLLALLKPLLFGGVYDGLGMSLLHCPLEYDKEFVRLPSILPFNFALSKETVQLLLTGETVGRDGNDNKKEDQLNGYAFYPDISKGENNMLLFALLSSLDSAFCLDENVIVNYSPPPSSVMQSQQSQSTRPPTYQFFEYDQHQQRYNPDSRMISNFMLQLYIRTTRKVLIKNMIRFVYTKNSVTTSITDTLRILLDMYDHDESCVKIGHLLQNQEKFEKYLPETCKLHSIQKYVIGLQHHYETNGLKHVAVMSQHGDGDKTTKENSNFIRFVDAKSMSSSQHSGPRVAVITAIYGNRGYEKTLKRFAMQTVSTDFICFTDNPDLTSSIDHQGKANNHGWIIDRTPYHLQSLQEDLDLNQTEYRNSLFRNRHPFNIAKFYKTSFHQIPRIRDGGYDAVIWMDGTIRITDHEMSSKILSIFEEHSEEVMIVFEHSRQGNLKEEADISLLMPRYNRASWQRIPQPLQNVSWQYESYLYSSFVDENDPNRLVSAFPRYRHSSSNSLLTSDNPSSSTHIGTTITTTGEEEILSTSTNSIPKPTTVRNYDPNFWKPIQLLRPQYGVWCTCFIAFNMKHQQSIYFLKAWYNQIKQFTTQDQVSFAYLTQALSIFPYSLPDDRIFGNLDFNTLFIKAEHGQ